MEPRSIEPKDIRVGDWVRAEANATTVEGEVTTIGSSGVIGVGSILSLVRGCWSFLLLDRPEPPREVGSRWRDPETGAEYVLSDCMNGDSPVYVLYLRTREASSVCAAWGDAAAEIIARLVPLDGE